MRVQQADQWQYKRRTMDRLLQVNPITRVSDLTAETDYFRLVEVLVFNSLEISSTLTKAVNLWLFMKVGLRSFESFELRFYDQVWQISWYIQIFQVWQISRYPNISGATRRPGSSTRLLCGESSCGWSHIFHEEDENMVILLKYNGLF